MRLLAVSPSLDGERQLSHTGGKLEAVTGLVMPSAALATSTVVAGRLVLVPSVAAAGAGTGEAGVRHCKIYYL